MCNTKKLNTHFEFNSQGKIKINVDEDGRTEEVKFLDENPKMMEYRKSYDNDILRSSRFFYNQKCIEIQYRYDPSGRLITANIIRESLFESDIYKMTCNYEKDKIIRKLYINNEFIGKDTTYLSKIDEWLHIYTNKRFASFKEQISFDINGEIINISLEPIKNNYTLPNSNDTIVVG